MAWKKNSPAEIARFDEVAPVPGAVRKILFGCPVYLLGEERYATLHAGRIALRLAPKDLAELIAKGGKPFAPIKGRASKDRATVPESIASNTRSLRAWIAKAASYAR
jgi:hypothetical protein